MNNEFMLWQFPYLLVVLVTLFIILFIILWVRFGLKLKAAGNQLGNNSLRQAGNIIMFIFWFFAITAMLLLVCTLGIASFGPKTNWFWYF